MSLVTLSGISYEGWGRRGFFNGIRNPMYYDSFLHRQEQFAASQAEPATFGWSE
jgi:hypothetical protein